MTRSMSFFFVSLVVGLVAQGCGGTSGTSGITGGGTTPDEATPEVVEAGTGSEVLTPAQEAQLELGKLWYEATCMSCHQMDGQGQEGLAPPFDPEWLARPPAQLIRIVLHGLRGPVVVMGRTYELEMPTLWVLEDEQIAATLTYVRRTWGGGGLSFVDRATVTAIRKATEQRLDPWTVEELDALPELGGEGEAGP